jgi:hypothetical protein
MPPTNPPPGRPPFVSGLVKMLFLDIGLALLAYYGMRVLGYDSYLSLLAGTVVAGLRVAYVAVRSRRLDAFAGFLLVIFGIGLVGSVLTGDARFLLLKESVTTAVAGLLFLGSAVAGRPLTFYAAKRLSAGQPDRVAYLDRRWAESALLRRQFTLISVVWGVGLLLEAAVRVPLVYLLSVDTMAGLSQAMQIATFAVLILWTLRYRRRMAATAQAQPAAA